MTKHMVPLLGLAALLASCGPILEQQHLPVPRTDGAQQAFALQPEALTLAAARQLNQDPYLRQVEHGGLGQSARLVPETSVLGVSAPPSTDPIPYRIGVGDDLQLVIISPPRGLGDSALERPVPSGVPTGVTADTAPENTLSRAARVGADGTVLFLETGRIAVQGKTLAEARDVLGNALIRAGVDPRFQLEVTGFNSQKINLTVVAGQTARENVTVSVTGGVKGTGSYPVTERPITLRELLVTAGMEISRSGVQIVSIDRSSRRYEMPVEHVFEAGSPDYFLTGGDTIRVEQFTYAEDRAYILGGGSQPGSLPLSAQGRPTLADILFVDGGPFATKSARSSEIYLLRGSDPMRAYHLDARDPSRIAVAAETELRPNDIVYLTSKPIYSLNELIGAVNPIAVFAGR